MINVLIFSGSDMNQEYEFFCTNATKKEVFNLYLKLERNNQRSEKGIDPFYDFKNNYIYHLISSSQSCGLTIDDIRLLQIDMEIDQDDLADIVEQETELLEKYCN